jgi:spore germination protein (amino acid permease)
VSFQSGRMGSAEGIALVFTISFTTACLTLPSEAIEISGELGWLSIIVSGLSTMAMLFLFIYTFERIPGDLLFIATHLFGKLGACLISSYYIVMFFSIAIIWIRQFAENTLVMSLPSLNFQLAVGWYILGAAFIIYFGIEAIARANYVILPFIVGAILLILVMLVPLYKPNYLFPWRGTGMSNALIKGGLLVGSNAGALLLAVIAKSFQNTRVLRTAAVFGLGGSILLKSVAVLILTMVFGTAVATERTLPFFDMARIVSLNRYIQHIESLYIILWVMCGVFGIAISIYMGLYLMTRLINLPTMKPLIPIITILLAQIAMIPPDTSSVLAFESVMVRGYYHIGIYVIPLSLFIATLLKEKKGTKCASR